MAKSKVQKCTRGNDKFEAPRDSMLVELEMPTHCKLKWPMSLGFENELLMTLKVFVTHFTILNGLLYFTKNAIDSRGYNRAQHSIPAVHFHSPSVHEL